MFRKFFAKAGALAALAVLLCASTAFAEPNCKIVVKYTGIKDRVLYGPYVDGYSDQVCMRVYVQLTEMPAQRLLFKITRGDGLAVGTEDSNIGISYTGFPEGSGENAIPEDVLGDRDATIYPTYEQAIKSTVALGLNGKPGQTVFEVRDYLCEAVGVHYNLPKELEDDKDYGWKVEVTAAYGIDEAGNTVRLNYEIIEEELEIKKAFNFVPVNGAVAQGVEDTALVVSATDTSLFACTTWNEWALVPSNEVAFTEASLVDGLPGEIAVVDGKIVYNPESDYNTEDFWEGDTEPFIEAKAVWTKNPEMFVTVRIPVAIKAVEDATRVSDWEWQMDDFTEGAAIPGFDGEDSLGKVIFYLDDVDVVEEAPDCRDAQLSLVNAAGETVMVLNGSYEVTNATGPYTLVFTASADQAVPYDLVKHNAASAEYGVKLTYVTAEGDEANVVKTQEVRTVTVYDTDRAPVVTNFVVNGLENGVAYADSKLSFACDFTDADAEDMEHISTTVKFSVDGDTWNDVAQLPAVLTKGDTYLFYASASYDSDWQVGDADEYAGNSIIVHVKNTAPVADKAGANLFIQREEGVTEGRTKSCTFTITDIDGADDLILALDANGTEGTEITDNNGTLALALVDGTVTAEFTMNDAIGTDADVTNMQYTFYVGDNGNDGSFANAIALNVTVDYMADPAPVVAVVTGVESTYAEVDAEGAATVITAAVKAADSNTAVAPTGVKNVTWTLTGASRGVVAVTDTQFTASEGTAEAAASMSFTLGYDFFAGADRLGSERFTLTCTVADGNGAAQTVTVGEFTVTDVDRAPAVASVTGAFDSEAIDGVTYSFAFTGTDPDGDAVYGNVELKAEYCGDNADYTEIRTEELSEVAASDEVQSKLIGKKGDKFTVTVTPVSTPAYGGAALTGDAVTGETSAMVENSSPVIGDAQRIVIEESEDGVSAYTYQVAVEGTEDVIAAWSDADYTAGRDSIKYSVEAAGCEGIADVVIDEVSGVITVTPVKFKNTSALETLPAFDIIVTDESGASVKTTAELEIAPVNQAPVIAAKDIYIIPAECNGEVLTKVFNVTMGGDADEDSQLLVEPVVELTADEQGIIAEGYTVEVVNEDEARQIKLLFAMAEGAADKMGAEAYFTVRVSDEEGGVSEAVTIKVMLGASPWYPIIAFDASSDAPVAPAGHTVVLKGSDNSEYSIIIKGQRSEVLPVDYIAGGIPGYTDEVEVTAEIYAWDPTEGTAAEVKDTVSVVVNAYGLPGEATASGEVVAGENGWFTLPDINVPMAKSYIIEVMDASGAVVKTIGPKDFSADEESGMILPDLTGMQLQLVTAGEYTVSVTGVNPNGKGVAAVVAAITVEGEAVEELVWPETGFAPAEGAILTSATVKFSWPVVAAAESYTLLVFDQNGKQCFKAENLTGNDCTATLDMVEGKALSYTWDVIANGATSKLASRIFGFTMCESTNAVVPSKVYAENGTMAVDYEGAIADGSTATYDCQYFDMATMSWINVLDVAVTFNPNGTITLDIPAKANDCAILRLKVDGEVVMDWTAYLIQ